MAGAAQDGGLCHPFGLRIRLSVATRRGDDPAARPGISGNRHRCAVSARREFPHLGGIRGALPVGIAGIGASIRCRIMTERALRILLPAIALALGILAWDLMVRIKTIPPYVLPSPGLVFATLFSDWP